MLTQAELVRLMIDRGAHVDDVQDLVNELGNEGIAEDDPRIATAIANSLAKQPGRDQQAAEDIQNNRFDAAGGPEQMAALDRAFEMNLVGPDNIANIAASFGGVFETYGTGQDAVDVIRSTMGFGPATENARFFPIGDPAANAALDDIRNQFGVGDNDLTTIADPSDTDDATREALTGIGLLYRGLNKNGDIIAVDARGHEFIYGRNEDGSLFRIGDAGSDGTAGGGGGGAARVNMQNIGVDKDGFALVFNPATGSISRGPQVGFAQIDPRTIAAEEARQFNEQQGLKEGEFLRDVLSNGRNFLTAAFLSRGQAGGSPLAATTQQDLLSRGFGPQQAQGGLNQALGFLNPEDKAKVPGFVLEGLGDSGTSGINPAFGALQPGGALGPAAGAVRPGEVDPTTLAGSGAPFGQTSAFATGNKPTGPGFDGQAAVSPTNLGDMALAFAPPAVKDIAAGREVGSLSTGGGGFAIPLASPQTLANLTKNEAGALDTTLQNVDQRTLDEFQQESNQRFRGQGSRTATGV